MKITNEEAIKMLKEFAIVDAIQEDYDVIDMAIEALEKQIPKEPIEKESGWYYCPTCNTKVPAYANYCCGYYTGKQGCGQRLDWEELK